MLLDLALKSTVVLVAAFAVAAAMHRTSAALRHLAWTCAFAGLLALPLLQRSAPRWHVPLSAPAVVKIAEVPHAPVPVSQHRWNFTAIWYAGIGLAAIRLLIAFANLHRLRKNARKAAWSAASGPCVLESDRIDLPITFGLIRPVILFPSAAAHWPPEWRRIVLAHELAHVKRLDCLTQLVVEAGCAIYWFQPLVWFAATQFRKERERACDDAVLNGGSKSSEYAEHLLAVVKSVHAKGVPAMALSMNSHDLQERLHAVLRPHMNRRAATPKLAIAAALIATAILVPIATMRAQAPGSASSVGGSISDASGAAVPHATVTATSLDTHNKEVTRSGEDGTFKISLSPGRYTLEVNASGFAPFRKQMTISPGQTLPLDAALDLGSVVENIDVVAPKPAASTDVPHRIPQRIRVGGNVQAVKLVYQTKPTYPAHAQQNGIEGSVVLQGVISTTGNLIGVEVLSKAVDPELTQAAADAVSQWRWEPTLLNGEPVEVVTTITLNFRLD
jgi:TonB family protein